MSERKLRAFLVYECQEGWCVEPTEMGADYTKNRPSRTRSYSKFSQLAFHLAKRINEHDRLAQQDRAPQS